MENKHKAMENKQYDEHKAMENKHKAMENEKKYYAMLKTSIFNGLLTDKDYKNIFGKAVWKEIKDDKE